MTYANSVKQQPPQHVSCTTSWASLYLTVKAKIQVVEKQQLSLTGFM